MARERWEEMGVDSLFYEQMVTPILGEDPEHRELVKQAYVARGELSSVEASLETMHEGEARVQWWVDQLEAGAVDSEQLLSEMLAQAQEGGEGLSTDPRVVEYRQQIAEQLEQVLESEGEQALLQDALWELREGYPAQEVALPDYDPMMAMEDRESWSLFEEWMRGRWEEVETLLEEDASYASAAIDFDGPLEELADEELAFEGVTAVRLGVVDQTDWFIREDARGEQQWSLHVERGHEGFAAGDVIELARDDGESIRIESEGGGAAELASAFNEALGQDDRARGEDSDPPAFADGMETLVIDFPAEAGDWSLTPEAFDSMRLETVEGAVYELTELPAESFAQIHAESLDAWRDELAEAGWPTNPQELFDGPVMGALDEGGL